MKIFVFSWNTQSVSFNETNSNFVKKLAKKIIDADCDLVVLGLQEDSIRDSLLLTRDGLVENELKGKYTLVDQTFLSGWGSTTFKALKDEWKYLPRGLRIALFKKEWIVVKETAVTTFLTPGIQNLITFGKGGAAIFVSTDVGDFTFLNVHLPFNSRSIVNEKCRPQELLWQAKCLKSLYQRVIEWKEIDHLILFGDLNFRVRVGEEISGITLVQEMIADSVAIQKISKESDELTLLKQYSQQQEEVVPIFLEGLDDAGLSFLPTCKLKQNRDLTIPICANHFSLGKTNKRMPSWCDRILYFNKQMICERYCRWEAEEMNLSDHSAVVGIFCVKENNL